MAHAGFVGRVRRRLLGVSPASLSFEKMGFSVVEPQVRKRLGTVIQTFVAGYNAAVAWGDPEAVLEALDGFPPEDRGFAYEGAAMGLSVLDAVVPGARDRFARFAAGPGGAHYYMIHVGAGWAAAKVRFQARAIFARLDPDFVWLALEGLGFHDSLFHTRRTVRQGRRPGWVEGYGRRAFDQGVGRSLWFVEGTQVPRIQAAIDGSFAPWRRGDLWSGVGLACGYAGGVSGEVIEDLRRAAGDHARCLAQGAAFAAGARKRAGNPSAHTDLACRILCGVPAVEAAASMEAIMDASLAGVPADATAPTFEMIRRRLQDRFVEVEEGAAALRA